MRSIELSLGGNPVYKNARWTDIEGWEWAWCAVCDIACVVCKACGHYSRHMGPHCLFCGEAKEHHVIYNECGLTPTVKQILGEEKLESENKRGEKILEQVSDLIEELKDLPGEDWINKVFGNFSENDRNEAKKYWNTK